MIMASRCKKVKNPCKICLAQVTRKSGIQCEGACGSWVHYKCLNYTPGRISDIKRGLIIISCPCPDCKTNMPKEIVKDEPFSCTNAYCPANIPPKCINVHCPSNAVCPPPGHNSLLAGPPQVRPMPQYGPCTVDTCKNTRVSPSHQQPRSMTCCSGGDIKKAECVTQTRSPCPPIACMPPPRRKPSPPKNKYNNNQAAKQNAAALKAMERMCNTMGQLTSQLNTLMDKMQALSIPPSPDYNMSSMNADSCSLTQLPCCCPGGGQSNGINKQQSKNSIPAVSPCCLQDQEDCNYSSNSQPPCFCSSNPLRRFY